jgi:hypothetical protein
MDVAIESFLLEAGFTGPEALTTARALLEAEGLTRPGKQRMAESKLPLALELLETRLSRACPACLPRARSRGDGRKLVEVAVEGCPVCRGSDNRRAVAELLGACRRRHVERILIVGGTATLYAHLLELAHEAGDGVLWRFVDGAEAVHTRNEATAHMQWAHLVLIWGSTPLPHKVSQLYTHHPLAGKVKTVTVTQRGIAGLCTAALRAVGGDGLP